MTTLQFGMAIINWLGADPAHVIVAFAAIAAMTPTPKPGTVAAKLYRVIDILALNFLHAKSTGTAPVVIAEQVASLLQQKLSANVAPTNAPTPSAAPSAPNQEQSQ